MCLSLQLNVLNKAGLSKDNFENSEAKVMEDTRQSKINDFFNSSTASEDDFDAIWQDIVDNDLFEKEDDEEEHSAAKRIKIDE